MHQRVSPYFLTHHLTKRGADNAFQDSMGEDVIKSALKRLDRYTENEARSTAAQTLQTVYGLVQNVKILIDG
jgi:hypothetical protein